MLQEKIAYCWKDVIWKLKMLEEECVSVLVWSAAAAVNVYDV